ncbi:MAG TPA: sodium:solute symporter [Planctomycetota bacterium]|nr:sodium:solute symporter [Planctomycetota bacterium]
MRPADWIVLGASLALVVAFGVFRSRRRDDLPGYLLAGRGAPWFLVAVSTMATQASAITFLTTPGQAYAEGMRFVQFYFGLPLAMVLICATVVPAFHRSRVFTAYEFLERRFDARTRTLTAGLFLLQRGLQAGLTIYAPALLISVLLGWDIRVTTFVTGGLAVVYTTTGGAAAVTRTQLVQSLVILGGMATAFVASLRLLPAGAGLSDAMAVAGVAGRMEAVRVSFEWSDKYNLWSGLIGGLFLQLSYFGTDQSQVQRYLTGSSVAQSRLGLLFNGLLKVPMQFAILLVGTLLFAVHHFVPSPVYFDPLATKALESGPQAAEYRAIETEHRAAFEERRAAAERFVEARGHADETARDEARTSLVRAQQRFESSRARAAKLAGKTDTNYVFLRFVLDWLPAGVVGLVLAAVFAASMSSTSAELCALATATTIDVYRRWMRPDATDAQCVRVSRWLVVAWGAFAVVFAGFASGLGTLVEAVNKVGSLFYGSILGIFVVAFLLRGVRGTAVCLAAIVAEVGVLALAKTTDVSFLWFNAFGCLAVVALAIAFSAIAPGRRERGARGA